MYASKSKPRSGQPKPVLQDTDESGTEDDTPLLARGRVSKTLSLYNKISCTHTNAISNL